MRKSDAAGTTSYLRSSVLGGQVVCEVDGAGIWQRGYVYLGSQLLAVQQAGVYWLHQDPVTKSQRVTTQAGAVESAIDLDPWGGQTTRSAAAAFQPRRYTTYERDADNGDEAQQRRYSGYWARFFQPDPYAGSYDLADPQSLNRYSYVQNDPVNYVDPSGLWSMLGCAAQFGACAGGWDAGGQGYSGHPFDSGYARVYYLWQGDERGYRSIYFDGGIAAVFPQDKARGPQQPAPTEGDTNAVNGALGACGTGASIGQYSNVRSDGWWRGRNGSWNRPGWSGNGATGGRSVAVGRAGAFSLLSRAIGTVGAGFSFYQGIQAYRRGDNTGATKGGLDGGMSLVGALGGPLGAGASGLYFSVDATIGWRRVLTPSPEEYRRTEYYCRHGLR